MRIRVCEGANTYFKHNSSKLFSCICVSANTGPTCIRAKINSSRTLSCMYWFCAGGYEQTWGCGDESLEAQQRYFSYRAILAAIVSQNSFVLVYVGYRTIIARYVAKWGIAQMCLCETKYQGGVSHHFGGVLTSLKKYRAIWSIAAIVSQYRAIWGH